MTKHVLAFIEEPLIIDRVPCIEIVVQLVLTAQFNKLFLLPLPIAIAIYHLPFTICYLPFAQRRLQQ